LVGLLFDDGDDLVDTVYSIFFDVKNVLRLHRRRTEAARRGASPRYRTACRTPGCALRSVRAARPYSIVGRSGTKVEMPTNSRPFLGSTAENPAYFVDARDQRVDVRGRVVQRERRARRAIDTVPLHQRHRAVMPRAYRDAAIVEDRADVVRMDAVERKERMPAFFRAVPTMRSPESRRRAPSRPRAGRRRARRSRRRRSPTRSRGCAEADGAGDVRCARLELVREVVVLAVSKVTERSCRRRPGRAASVRVRSLPYSTRPGRREQLVAGNA